MAEMRLPLPSPVTGISETHLPERKLMAEMRLPLMPLVTGTAEMLMSEVSMASAVPVPIRERYRSLETLVLPGSSLDEQPSPQAVFIWDEREHLAPAPAQNALIISPEQPQTCCLAGKVFRETGQILSQPMVEYPKQSLLLPPQRAAMKPIRPLKESLVRLDAPKPELSKAEKYALAKRQGSMFPQRKQPLGLSAMEDWESFQEMEELAGKPRPPHLSVNPPSPDPEPPPLLSALTTPLSSPAESEMDFGAFEILPDSEVTPADLRAGPTDAAPLIHYGDLPVHSVHHQTVKTETAVLSLLSSSDTVLSDTLPPFVVNDNYCFVVDAAKIPMEDIAGDDKYWRHTSRPTKYYYSDDLKHFQKVNVLMSRNKIHSARFPKNPQPALTLDASAPASSMAAARGHGLSSSFSHSFKKDEDAPLQNVFKVIRFYSFWKTCTSFHRIVTLVDPVLENDATSLIKKRLFVQYLWRNAKEADKQRVASEFDPKTQLTESIPMSSSAGPSRQATLTKSPSSSSSTTTASSAAASSRGWSLESKTPKTTPRTTPKGTPAKAPTKSLKPPSGKPGSARKASPGAKKAKK